MHVKLFLHKLLAPVMHLKRLETLKKMVEAALVNKKLSVTQLGRSLETKASEKSNILRSNRFIDNPKLSNEREEIIKQFIHLSMGSKKRPWLLVDWTLVPNTTEWVLRAALAKEGRAIVLYEEVHAERLMCSRKIHSHFLKKLNEFLPTDCCPIVVTDAGFHNPWFEDVKNLGWDYVGRVRGRKLYRKVETDTWRLCNTLHRKATPSGQYMGKVELCRRSVWQTHFYLIKQKKKGRVVLNKYGYKRIDKHDRKYAASTREPWLLATSLGKRHSTGSKIFKIYAARMQIEEGIRDLKSSRYGFSFKEAMSRKAERIEILLLIAMIASFIAWVTGWIGEKNLWHYQFQANSIKNTRVLSLFFLGCRIIKKKITIPIKRFLQAINDSMKFDFADVKL